MSESDRKLRLIKDFMRRYNISQLEDAIERIDQAILQEAVETLNFSKDSDYIEMIKKDLFDNYTPNIKNAQRGLLGGKRNNMNNYLPFNWSDKNAQDVYEYFGGCALTGDVNNIEFDHFIPISWGHGGTYKGNMIPLRDDLNSSKDNQNPFEWINNPSTKREINPERWNYLIKSLADLHNLSTEEYRQYVYWCSDNRRKPDNAIRFSSVILWYASK